MPRLCLHIKSTKQNYFLNNKRKFLFSFFLQLPAYKLLNSNLLAVSKKAREKLRR